MELAPIAILAHFQTLPYMRPTSLDGIIGEGTRKICKFFEIFNADGNVLLIIIFLFFFSVIIIE